MKRREFLKRFIYTTSALSLSGSRSLAGGLNLANQSLGLRLGANRYNLVYVFPDQMRGQAMGFLNEEPVITPNLDKFATESLVLPNAVSNWPVCSPYRGMFMTGKYPHANRVLTNCNSGSAPYDNRLQKADRCWSDILRDRGYSLGYIGKWHLEAPLNDGVVPNGSWNEWTTPDRRHGFDFWYSYGTYDAHMNPMYWDTDAPRDGYHFAGQWGPEHEADLTVKYIHNEGGTYRDPNKPFALVVSMNPPHMPYGAFPASYLQYYQDISDEQLFSRPNIPPAGTQWGDYYRNNIRNYFAMITGVDEQFGRILQALKDKGMDKDTIVVFTSDHGNCLGIHDKISKSNPYEESMRVPFIIRWPDKIKPRNDNLLFSVPDVYPTLMDLMGYADDIPSSIQGTSHAQLFMTGKGKRPASQLFMNVSVNKEAWGQRGVRTRRYTMVIEKKEGQPDTYTLFDNQNDPYQLNEISATRPDIIAELTVELEKWLQAHNDPWLNS
jgi:uncharacterized sulfatase